MKINKIIIPILTVLLFSSCSGNKEEIKAEKVVLNDDVITIYAGDNADINYTVLPENTTNKEVNITSQDSKIVSINENKLRALKVGESKVVVRSKSNKNAYDYCNVVVVTDYKKSSYYFDKNSGLPLTDSYSTFDKEYTSYDGKATSTFTFNNVKKYNDGFASISNGGYIVSKTVSKTAPYFIAEYTGGKLYYSLSVFDSDYAEPVLIKSGEPVFNNYTHNKFKIFADGNVDISTLTVGYSSLVPQNIFTGAELENSATFEFDGNLLTLTEKGANNYNNNHVIYTSLPTKFNDNYFLEYRMKDIFTPAGGGGFSGPGVYTQNGSALWGFSVAAFYDLKSGTFRGYSGVAGNNQGHFVFSDRSFTVEEIKDKLIRFEHRALSPNKAMYTIYVDGEKIGTHLATGPYDAAKNSTFTGFSMEDCPVDQSCSFYDIHYGYINDGNTPFNITDFSKVQLNDGKFTFFNKGNLYEGTYEGDVSISNKKMIMKKGSKLSLKTPGGLSAKLDFEGELTYSYGSITSDIGGNFVLVSGDETSLPLVNYFAINAVEDTDISSLQIILTGDLSDPFVNVNNAYHVFEFNKQKLYVTGDYPNENNEFVDYLPAYLDSALDYNFDFSVDVDATSSASFVNDGVIFKLANATGTYGQSVLLNWANHNVIVRSANNWNAHVGYDFGIEFDNHIYNNLTLTFKRRILIAEEDKTSSYGGDISEGAPYIEYTIIVSKDQISSTPLIITDVITSKTNLDFDGALGLGIEHSVTADRSRGVYFTNISYQSVEVE